MNLHELAFEHEGDHDGFRSRGVGIGERIGAALLGGSVYELPPGERTFPFHYHYGVEEWLGVLAGHPTLRTPAGEQVLDPWDTACFPVGPEGSHLLRNDGDEPARVLNFLRSDAVEYWAGE